MIWRRLMYWYMRAHGYVSSMDAPYECVSSMNTKKNKPSIGFKYERKTEVSPEFQVWTYRMDVLQVWTPKPSIGFKYERRMAVSPERGKGFNRGTCVRLLGRRAPAVDEGTAVPGGCVYAIFYFLYLSSGTQRGPAQWIRWNSNCPTMSRQAVDDNTYK